METVNLQKDKSFHPDGLSFYSQLLGDNTKKRDLIYSYYAPNWSNFENSAYVQDNAWKLYEDGRIYSMTSDPLEQTPLKKSSLSKKVRKKISSFKRVIKGYEKLE